MVLIDEEENYIYATIPSFIWDRFSSKVHDGKIHLLKRFDILPNKTEYRVVSDNKLMIKFLFDTYIKNLEEDNPKIPKHKFDFLKFHNISHRRDNHSVLTDLIGVVVDEHSKENYFAIEIEDKRGERVRVTLWDQCRIDFQDQKKKLTDGNIIGSIAIITSLMVKDYNGYNSVSTSISSNLYINLDLPEVIALKEARSAKYGESDIACLNNHTTPIIEKDLNSILTHCTSEYKEDMICYCIAQVKDIIAEKPWYYPSCINCTTRPQYNTERLYFYCNNCEKKVETQTIRYRIDLKVQSTNHTAIFVIFDKEARKLIGQDASTLQTRKNLRKKMTRTTTQCLL